MADLRSRAGEADVSRDGLVRQKVILVTGAARGMGAQTARWLAREGAAVVLCDILDGQGEQVAQEIAKESPALYLSLDVTDKGAWSIAVENVLDNLGRIDGLVNCAGSNQTSTLMDLDLELLNRMMAVNVVGPLYGIQAVVPVLRAGGGGTIVNVVSVGGFRASPSAAYGVSKWALRSLTMTAAMEFASDGIRVNAIHPGLIDTDMSRGVVGDSIGRFADATPLGRLGNPDDVAPLIGYLCSDACSYMTGAEIVVDGGFMLWSALNGKRT